MQRRRAAATTSRRGHRKGIPTEQTSRLETFHNCLTACFASMTAIDTGCWKLPTRRKPCRAAPMRGASTLDLAIRLASCTDRTSDWLW